MARMFHTERDLQHVFSTFLNTLNIRTELEHRINVGTSSDPDIRRIDVLTPDTIFECKKDISSQNIYHAMGQISVYSRFYPWHKLTIVAETIKDDSVINSLKESGIGLIILDRNHQFLNFYRRNLNPAQYSGNRIFARGFNIIDLILSRPKIYVASCFGLFAFIAILVVLVG